MKIHYRQSIIQIDSIQQLLDYINNTPNHGLKWLGVKPEVKPIVQDWLDTDIAIRHKKIYSTFRKVIGAKSNRIMQLEYYLERGYDLEFAQHQVSKIQSTRTKKGWQDNKFKLRLLPIHKEYWIKRGYSDKAAILKVKERQTTFSLSKCIEKHGETTGIQIFNQRQQLWQSNLDYSKFSTAVTWEVIRKKNNTFADAFKEWIEIAISRRKRGTSNSIILEKILKININSVNDLKKWCLNNHNTLNINQSILSVLGLTDLEWKEQYLKYHNILLNKTPSLAGIYGNRYYMDGNYYESDGELSVAFLLKELKLNFNIHKYYPNKSYKYDFYLPHFNTYIEWTGMSPKYYVEKKEQLKDFNIIWINNIQELRQRLTNL